MKGRPLTRYRARPKWIRIEASSTQPERQSPARNSASGISQEPGPIFGLSIAPDDETFTYFLINTDAQPSFTEITDEGEVPIVLGPDTLNEAFIEKLFRMGEDDEIGGDEVNRYNLDQLLESDVIRIVDLKRDVYWVLGGGQYPSLRK